MTFTHDDIKNRLIEFLYGELGEEARAAFDAHVAACPSCRADVTTFQETRRVARAAVREGLAEPVPAGVRARVLEAAAAAKGAKEVPGAVGAGGQAGTAAAETLPKKLVKRTDEPGGPFAWLRARWAIPMFATVAAMGVLLLVRETIFREARRPLGETASGQGAPPAPTAAPVAPAADASSATPAGAAEPAEDVREGKKSGGAPAEWPDSPAGPKVRRRKPTVAVAPAQPTPKIIAKGNIDDLLSGDGAGTGSAPLGASAAKAKRAPSAKPQAEPRDEVMSGLGRSQADLDADTREAPLAKNLSRVAAGRPEASAGRFAQPPPPAPLAAPAPAAKRARAKAEAASDDRAAESEAPAAAQVASASAADESDGAVPADPAAPLAARAEKLMASRQWVEAATAYRQLIARYPKHEQVPNWKRRLAVVEAAAAKVAPSGTGFATPPPAR